MRLKTVPVLKAFVQRSRSLLCGVQPVHVCDGALVLCSCACNSLQGCTSWCSGKLVMAHACAACIFVMFHVFVHQACLWSGSSAVQSQACTRLHGYRPIASLQASLREPRSVCGAAKAPGAPFKALEMLLFASVASLGRDSRSGHGAARLGCCNSTNAASSFAITLATILITTCEA